MKSLLILVLGANDSAFQSKVGVGLKQGLGNVWFKRWVSLEKLSTNDIFKVFQVVQPRNVHPTFDANFKSMSGQDG